MKQAGLGVVVAAWWAAELMYLYCRAQGGGEGRGGGLFSMHRYSAACFCEMHLLVGHGQVHNIKQAAAVVLI